MTDANKYDVIIVGGGPIGIACALECSKNQLNYLVIEKGCLVNSLYNYPQNMTFFSTSEKLEIGNVPFVCTNAKPTRTEALEYYRRVSKLAELNTNLFEEVLEINELIHHQFRYSLVSSKGNYVTKNIIIATGFHDLPYLLNVPGENLPKVTHYYKDPHFYAFQNVLVIGANNSAIAELRELGPNSHSISTNSLDDIHWSLNLSFQVLNKLKSISFSGSSP